MDKMRLEAMRLAIASGVEPERVIEQAEKIFEFMLGRQSNTPCCPDFAPLLDKPSNS